MVSRFVTLAVLLLAVGSALAALTCLGDDKKCEENECCVEFTSFVGLCKKLRIEDERCEVNPGKHGFLGHVYKTMCPCVYGFKCVAEDGVVGGNLGTCQPDPSVQPEHEAED